MPTMTMKGNSMSAHQVGSENRETITGIVIHVVNSSGLARTITLDPASNEALFWTDRAVDEILAPFYAQHETLLSREELEENFGPEALTLLQKLRIEENPFRITPDLIRALWRIVDRNGVMFPFIRKAKKCIPTGGGGGK